MTVGDLSGPIGRVDRAGSLLLDDPPVTVAWAVRADRWYRPGDEVAVRRTLLDDAPVPVTAMRVGGGDVVSRVAATAAGSARAAMIEVENDSPTPVALALVATSRFDGGRHRVEVSGDRIRVDGRTVLVVEGRVGARALAGPGDVLADLEAGPGAEQDEVVGHGTGGALVVPLPHSGIVRATVPVTSEVTGPVEVTAAAVASGWRAVAASAAHVSVPDPSSRERWRRLVPQLVLEAGSTDLAVAAAAAPVLDLVGLADEADRARASVLAAFDGTEPDGPAAVAGALALASRPLRAARPSGLGDVLTSVIAATGGSLDHETVEMLASALDLEDPRAAADLRRVAPDLSDGSTTGGGGMDLPRPLSLLVGERSDGVDLLPAPPVSWRGGPVDVRGLCTRWGALAWSVRWHGHRPALLWEADLRGGAHLRCPGLDPGWSSSEGRGEALLSAPA